MIQEQLVPDFLIRRFAALDAGDDDRGLRSRVYGEEFPDDVVKRIRQPQEDPLVCTMHQGGPPRAGILGLEVRRVDIHVVAPKPAEAFRVQKRIRKFMEDLCQTGAERGDYLKSAIRETAPQHRRTEDRRYSVVFSAWIVFMAGDLD